MSSKFQPTVFINCDLRPGSHLTNNSTEIAPLIIDNGILAQFIGKVPGFVRIPEQDHEEVSLILDVVT